MADSVEISSEQLLQMYRQTRALLLNIERILVERRVLRHPKAARQHPPISVDTVLQSE